MVARDAAFAGVMVKSAFCSAAVQRFNGFRAEAAKTHGGYVEHRRGIGLGGSRRTNCSTKSFFGGVFCRHRMGKPFIRWAVDIQMTSKTFYRGDVFRPPVNRISGFVTERAPLCFTLNDIRAKEWAQPADNPSKPANDWKVPPERVGRLNNIVQPHEGQPAK